MSTPQDEPGADDNRLSLDPSKFEAINDWEDGETYTFTVTARQVAPGEFIVENVEPHDEEETPKGEGTEGRTDEMEEAFNEDASNGGHGMSTHAAVDQDGATDEPAYGKGYQVNPAIKRLMRGAKR
jgi:hypothetical protein